MHWIDFMEKLVPVVDDLLKMVEEYREFKAARQEKSADAEKESK